MKDQILIKQQVELLRVSEVEQVIKEMPSGPQQQPNLTIKDTVYNKGTQDWTPSSKR